MSEAAQGRTRLYCFTITVCQLIGVQNTLIQIQTGEDHSFRRKAGMTAAAAELDVPENSSTAGPTYRRSTFAALRVPNFRIYAAGQCVANTGVWMQNIALDWLVLELTRRATAVG